MHALKSLGSTELLQHQDVWRARAGVVQAGVTVATGHTALDDCLLGHGWPLGRLGEVLMPQIGLGEISLLLPLLGRRTQQGCPLVYVRPPCPPNTPVLAAAGVDLHRLWLLLPASEREALWATEQLLASRMPVSVLIWVECADERALRRLSLAAEGTRSLAVLFRPPTSQVSPAALRLGIDGPLSRVPLKLLKARGLACTAAQPLLIRNEDKLGTAAL